MPFLRLAKHHVYSIFSDKKIRDPLNALRGFACLLVIIYHISLSGVKAASLFGHSIQWVFTANGQVGVLIFFYLSGFLLGKSFNNKHYNFTFKGLFQFYIKRIVRVIPLYYTIIVFILIKFNLLSTLHIQTIGIPLFTFSGERLVNTFPVSYLWTVSTQIKQYLLTPFVITFFSIIHNKFRISPYVQLIIVMLVSIFFRFQNLRLQNLEDLTNLNFNIHTNWLLNSDIFIFGIILSFMNSRKYFAGFFLKKYSIVYLNIIQTCLLISMYIIAGYAYENVYTQYWQYNYHYVAMPTIVMIVVGLFIILSQNESIKNKNNLFLQYKYWYFPNTWLAIIGILSYEIYLFHYIVIYSTSLTLHCNPMCSFQLFFRNISVVLSTSIFLAFTVKLIESILKDLKNPNVIPANHK